MLIVGLDMVDLQAKRYSTVYMDLETKWIVTTICNAIPTSITTYAGYARAHCYPISYSYS
jgi:hypothetical protein